jgi:hypothetical protein
MRFSTKPITIAALTLLLMVGAGASLASAKTLHASGHGVSAKLTFKVNKKMFTVSEPRIALTGSGGTRYSGTVKERVCGSGYCSHPTLDIANLGGTSAVVVSLFSGGAHCCSWARIYTQGRGGWKSINYDFADPGFRLVDLGHNGQREIETADDRFAYLLSDYADSGMPIQVLTLLNGKLTDVTRLYPALIKRDAARYWKAYQRDHSGGQIGQLAPWAADELNLGNTRLVEKTLAAQAARHRITAKQRTKLQHYLKSFGYTQ